jgi:hypothetical protein
MLIKSDGWVMNRKLCGVVDGSEDRVQVHCIS